MRWLALALCALIAVCGAAAFAAVPAGDEIQVNTVVITGQQDDAQVTMDPDGEFTVAWQSDELDGGGSHDVYVRRFGTPGFETVAHLETSGDQDDPAIASQANGEGVVAFHSDYLDGQGNQQQDILAHRFDTTFGPLDESDINVDLTPEVDDENPAVAMDADGDFVVAWESGGGQQVAARLFDENGGPVTDEFIVADDSAGQTTAAVAMDDAGNFVVAWDGGQEGSDGNGIFARRYDSAGNSQGPGVFQVNTTEAGAQEHAGVGLDADGDFVITWHGPGPAGSGTVFVQRYDEAGTPQGGETEVATAGGERGEPSITVDDDGDFAVVWHGNGPGDTEGVFTRDYTAAGAPVADPILVNQTVADQQHVAHVASDADGDFVVSWETAFAVADTENVFVRRFARGSAPGPGPGGGGPPGGGGSQVPPVLDDLGLPVLTDADVGIRANAAVVNGTVLLGIPSGLPTTARMGHASQKGVTFVPLTQARQIPIGSFLDTRRGTVRLRTATGTQNGTQTGNFGRGLFQLRQSSRPSARGLTDLVMKGGSFSRARRCRVRRSSSSAVAAQLSRRTVRRLRSNATGRFRTRGRNSSATVRGTVWVTTDRCDGTLTKVTRGSVVVRDLRRRRNIVVRAGKRTKGPGGGRGSYFARAR